jgi:hypothetical protein
MAIEQRLPGAVELIESSLIIPPPPTGEDGAPVDATAQLLANPLLSPIAVQGTNFRTPVTVGTNSPGQVSLLKRADFTAATGNLTGVPYEFEQGSVLYQIVVAVRTAFNGTTPRIDFGTTSNGAQLGTQPLNVAGFFYVQLLASLPLSNIMYVTLVLGNSSAGSAAALMIYAGQPAAPWS